MIKKMNILKLIKVLYIKKKIKYKIEIIKLLKIKKLKKT